MQISTLISNKYSAKKLEELRAIAVRLYFTNTLAEAKQLFKDVNKKYSWYSIDDAIIFEYGRESAIRYAISGLDNELNRRMTKEGRESGRKFAIKWFNIHLQERAQKEVINKGSLEAGLNIDV